MHEIFFAGVSMPACTNLVREYRRACSLCERDSSSLDDPVVKLQRTA
jgi:hypothetical protein